VSRHAGSGSKQQTPPHGFQTSVWTSVIRGALLEAEVLLLEAGEELTTQDRGSS